MSSWAVSAAGIPEAPDVPLRGLLVALRVVVPVPLIGVLAVAVVAAVAHRAPPPRLRPASCARVIRPQITAQVSGSQPDIHSRMRRS